jgi:hypothetical protein
MVNNLMCCSIPLGHTRSLPLQKMALIACVLLGVVGCAAAAPDSTEVPTTATSASRPAANGSDRAAEASILSKINAAIGQAPCNTDDQCRTIGLGANACGGPAGWRPWSTQTNGSGESLLALAEQYATLQRQRQSRDGMVSTCRYIPNPGAQCQAQRCVLKARSDPAS